jgi:prepilin-type N-terminal cleavage/methylation domain-containing protein
MSKVSDQRGFTLVETLVVMLIIGILAAIALALLTSQRSRAQDAEAKSGAALVMTTLLVYQQDHETFATADRADLAAIDSAIVNVPDFELDAGVETFEVVVTSRSGTEGGGPFTISYDRGQATRSCAEPGHGGCPDSGLW